MAKCWLRKGIVEDAEIERRSRLVLRVKDKWCQINEEDLGPINYNRGWKRS